jgi:hypothetical protein
MPLPNMALLPTAGIRQGLARPGFPRGLRIDRKLNFPEVSSVSRGMETARDWAWETFGSADLGDARRVSRLVTLAEAAAERPGGKLTRVCRNAAEQEGAYRLIESGLIDGDELSRAMVEATARRCAEAKSLVVALDETGINRGSARQEEARPDAAP